MSDVRFIGLTGRAGAGKDSAYTYGLAKYGFKRLAFADPVRGTAMAKAAADRGGTKRAWAESYVDHFGARKTADVRSALQWTGMNLRDTVDPGIWVYLTLKQAWDYIDDGWGVAFTDLRFLNEALVLRGDQFMLHRFYAMHEGPTDPEIFKALTTRRRDGGLLPDPRQALILKVTTSRDNDLTPEQRNDRSEREVDRIDEDRLVLNDGSIEDLIQEVDRAMLNVGFEPPTPRLSHGISWDF